MSKKVILDYGTPEGDIEAFLLRQFGPRRQKIVRGLKHLKRAEARIEVLLTEHSDQIALPPTWEEDFEYEELIGMVRACQAREWGKKSQLNLVQYIAVHFIPEIMSWASDER